MNTLFYSIGATILISMVSFIGILVVLVSKRVLNKILLWLVGFSAGTLIGGAFLHLIPEVIDAGMGDSIFAFVLLGFIAFFILEHLLSWHHCHKHGMDHEHCRAETRGYMNLIGDGLHNFIDGVIIAATFAINVNLGVATTLAVLMHEAPQELSDFGVLLHSGFSRNRAFFFNFLSALLAVVGAICGWFLISFFEQANLFLIAIAAGGFIYIAASDLVPEIHKEKDIRHSLISLAFFILGVVFLEVVFLGCLLGLDWMLGMLGFIRKCYKLR